jgi:hypothetical protein
MNETVELQDASGSPIGNAILPDPYAVDRQTQNDEPRIIRWRGTLFLFARMATALDGRRSAVYTMATIVDAADAPFF